MAAHRADDGKLLWRVMMKSQWGDDADPLILNGMVLVGSVIESSVIALDLKDGRELWRVNIPDCRYYYFLDD